MKINSIQQNQSNFRGVLHFKNAKEYTKLKPFDSSPMKTKWSVNANHIVDIYPAKGIDPFVEKEGYQTFIQTLTGVHVVKQAFDVCMKGWSHVLKHQGDIVEVNDNGIEKFDLACTGYKF